MLVGEHGSVKSLIARGWISKKATSTGVALAQLLPGPPEAKVAHHLGWAHDRVDGARAIAAAFMRPSCREGRAPSATYLR